MATTSQPLKIGLVLDDSLDKPDGVQQYILSIGEWLSSQGHDVHYLVGKTFRTDLINLHSLSRNVNVRFNGNRMSIPLPTSRRLLRQFLGRQQFDVLHVQMPYSPWLAHRLINLAPRSTVIIGTFHIVAYSKLVEAATKLLAVWTRKSLHRFDSVVSVSTAAQNYALKTYGIQSSVLPNVIDYARFHNAKPLTAADNVPTIIFLGRLVPRKGCLLLLQAIAQLNRAQELPDCRILICGKGPLSESLKTYVRTENLASVVEFVGFVSEADKPSYYATADIAVFPSRGGESFGIVLLEAMASGKAVVLGGDNSGYRSVLLPQSGLLFNPSDATELALKIKHYLTDEKDRRALARWGERYTKDFDVAVVGTKLLALYDRGLRNRLIP